MGNTSLLIRAQALGGKFLGSDINGFFLTVLDAAGNVLYPSTHWNGDAGVKPAPTSYAAGASVAVVVTPEGSSVPMVSWIVPDSGTVGQVVSFDLFEATWIEVIVNGVTMDGETPLPNLHEGRVRMLVPPGAQLTTDPGLIVVVPGLAVRLLTTSAQGPDVNVQAWVTMMCGCEIANGSPWTPDQFSVEAIIALQGGCDSPIRAPLTLQSTSTFGATVSLPNGTYDVWITAVQPGVGNTAAAKGTISVG